MGMASSSVVKHFDVVEHIGFGQVTGFIDPFPGAFLPQAAKKRFNYCVSQQLPRSLLSTSLPIMA